MALSGMFMISFRTFAASAARSTSTDFWGCCAETELVRANTTVNAHTPVRTKFFNIQPPQIQAGFLLIAILDFVPEWTDQCGDNGVKPI
jgi:hypothetical protein